MILNNSNGLFVLTMIIIYFAGGVNSFATCNNNNNHNNNAPTRTSFLLSQAPPGASSEEILRSEAEDLLAKARKLRSELPVEKVITKAEATAARASPWAVVSSDPSIEGEEFRLYIDIGREKGTWMDRRWGSSGRRIPFTLDVKLLPSVLADASIAKQMVKDNFGGKSSQTLSLETAKAARLRDGFDSMACHGGSYRIDSAGSQHTVRFYVAVDGTTADQDYGDISIPQGNLYFSIPCFGGRVSQLSTKEAPITVRQVGWNTGFRREESRMVGTFYARPIEAARRKDGF